VLRGDHEIDMVVVYRFVGFIGLEDRVKKFPT
jgi:hypothetical protein